MSDDLRTEPGAFPPSDQGEAGRSADGEAGSSQQGQASGQRVNLNDLPEFREYQSAMDRRIAAMQQQMSERERADEERRLAGMDEYERKDYIAEKYRRENEALRQQFELRDLEQQRERDITDLHKEYGVPVEMLQTAGTFKQAQEMAKLWKQKVAQEARATASDLVARAPDMGGGGYGRTYPQESIEMQRALSANDPVAVIRAARQAAQRR